MPKKIASDDPAYQQGFKAGREEMAQHIPVVVAESPITTIESLTNGLVAEIE